MGSQACPLPSAAGIRTANSTRPLYLGLVATLVSYIPGTVWSKILPSCTSAQVPRLFTLVSTRFNPLTLSVTPEDSFCISPRLLYTLSSCWDTVWNEAFSRVFKVPVSFSSTV